MPEQSIDQLPPSQLLPVTETTNLGMCTDVESNWQPFSAWSDNQLSYTLRATKAFLKEIKQKNNKISMEPQKSQKSQSNIEEKE